MDDLIAFCRARLDEDAQPPFQLVPYSCPPDCCAPEGWVGMKCNLCGIEEFGGTTKAMTEYGNEHAESVHQCSRSLAEVEAKRAILDLHAPFETKGWTGYAERDQARQMIKHLAAVWADHPEYQDRWRP